MGKTAFTFDLGASIAREGGAAAVVRLFCRMERGAGSKVRTSWLATLRLDVPVAFWIPSKGKFDPAIAEVAIRARRMEMQKRTMSAFLKSRA
jgi:hypothetical protein